MATKSRGNLWYNGGDEVNSVSCKIVEDKKMALTVDTRHNSHQSLSTYMIVFSKYVYIYLFYFFSLKIPLC